PNGWLGRAAAHAGRGRWDRAIADLKEADDRGEPCFHHLAVARLAGGMNDQYLRERKKVVERFAQGGGEEDNCPGAEARALTQLAAEEVAVLLTWAGKVNWYSSNDAERMHAAVYYRAGKFEEAERRLEALARGDRQDGAGWLWLSMTKHHLKKPAEARELLDR